MNKIVNRLPVANELVGGELVYGTDGGGNPQYIPALLLKTADTLVEAASQSASIAAASSAEIQGIEARLTSIRADAEKIRLDVINLKEQSRNLVTRATSAADGVTAERQVIEDLAKEVRGNAFAAQLAKEYADQAARAANSKYRFEVLAFDFDSTADQVEFVIPPGWFTMIVAVDGRLRRQGKNKDWTVSNDGIQDHILMAISPGQDAWVSVICGRKF